VTGNPPVFYLVAALLLLAIVGFLVWEERG
jgi:hypothetical protein